MTAPATLCLFFFAVCVDHAVARASNPWNEFQKANAGKGWNSGKMKHEYHKSDSGFFQIFKSMIGMIPGLDKVKAGMELYTSISELLSGSKDDMVAMELSGIHKEIAGYRSDQLYLGIAQLVVPLLVRLVESQFAESGSQDTTELDAMRYAQSLVLTEFEDHGFNEVHGHAVAKQQLRMAVKLPILNPELFQGLRSPHRGIILVGPPGNGKTFLAKALAADAKAPFIFCSPSDFRSMMHGVSEARVKAIFRLARSLAAAGSPVIIFIDELDGISDNRLTGGMKGGGQSLLSQLLVELDGFMSKSGDNIFVLGATNLLDHVDPALKREGRFDLKISVPPPNSTERTIFLKHVFKDTLHNITDKAFEGLGSKPCTGGFPYVTLRVMAQIAAKSVVADFSEMTNDKFKSLKVEDLRHVSVDDVLRSLTFIESKGDDEKDDTRASKLLRLLDDNKGDNQRMTDALRTNYDACSLHLQILLLSKDIVRLTEDNVDSKCGGASKAFCIVLLTSGSDREKLKKFAGIRNNAKLRNSRGEPIKFTWCTAKAAKSWSEADVLLVRTSHAKGLVFANTQLKHLEEVLQRYVEGTLASESWGKLPLDLSELLEYFQSERKKGTKREEL